MQNKNNNKQKSGYTIIETMIAVSLFLVIVMLGMGALLNANLLHRKSQSMRSILDNLSFVMEDMSRNLRTGYDYHCIDSGDSSLTNTNVRSCSDINGGGISFKSSLGGQWVYYISSTGKILKSTSGGVAGSFIQLTPDEINISSASSFTVVGAEPPSAGNNQQPFVTIKLVGSIITSSEVVTPFSLQTSVSQRKLDI